MSAEREALAKILNDADDRIQHDVGFGGYDPNGLPFWLADAVLTSDWLAAHDEAIRADELTLHGEAGETAIHTTSSIKIVGEALAFAETALLHFYPDTGQRAIYAGVIAHLLADVQRQSPTGPDGKHGDRHTPTCGCADVPRSTGADS